eukprot:6138839-Prymnesium_polylepis.1
MAGTRDVGVASSAGTASATTGTVDRALESHDLDSIMFDRMALDYSACDGSAFGVLALDSLATGCDSTLGGDSTPYAGD